jgi:hypothetical protein
MMSRLMKGFHFIIDEQIDEGCGGAGRPILRRFFMEEICVHKEYC